MIMVNEMINEKSTYNMYRQNISNNNVYKYISYNRNLKNDIFTI